jgi:hypothetical protein
MYLAFSEGWFEVDGRGIHEKQFLKRKKEHTSTLL